MVGDDTTRLTSILQIATNRSNSLAVLMATATLFAVFLAPAQAATPSPTMWDGPEHVQAAPLGSAGPQSLATTPTERRIQLASQLPRITTPQVHVNAAHVNTGSVHPAIGVNSGAVKIRGAHSQSLKLTNAHQFDKNNGGKGKGGNTKGGSGGSFLLKLDGIEGESTDSKGRSPDIQ